ncbi:hypothetical protein ABPG72_018480 [Tetrahymena utriculariae]
MQPYKKSPLIPYSAIYLDINWNYMFQALTQLVTPADRPLLEMLLQNLFLKNNPPKGVEEKMLLCASVRTAFDLVLQVLNLPLGSEIVMTAINIPDMVKVIRNHGLVPVPVDITDDTLGPSLEDFKKAFSDRTKVVMVSFLYGAKFDTEELYDYAHSRGCFIFEDQAESFSDINDNGSDKADCSLFSFGSIKPFTAYGGGIAVLRNQEVMYRKCKDILATYPVMPNSFFLKKILKNIPVYLGLNIPFFNSIFRPTLSSLGIDYKSKFVSMVRGFQPKENFLDTFRLQMPTAMMALLYFRLRDYDAVTYQMQIRKLRNAQTDFTSNGVTVPGRACKNRTFWLYPIITENPKLVFEILNARGVDAYLGATQLDLVESPIGSQYKYPQKTKDFFQKIIYLPLHRNVPPVEVNKIVQETIQVCKLVNDIEKDKKNKARPSL